MSLLEYKSSRFIKKISLIVAVISVACFFEASVFAADAPQVINYQAQFMQSPTEFEDRQLDLRFSFWSQSGLESSHITSSGSINTLSPEFADFLEVFEGITPNIEGVVSLGLGSTVPLPKIDPSRHAYMQVEIKLHGEDNTLYEVLDIDSQLGNGTDRRALVSVPYALNTDAVDGHDVGTSSGDIAVLNEDSQFDIDFIPGGTNSSIFRLNFDLDEANGIMALEFGSGASFSYNPLTDQFIFSTEIDFGHYQSNNFVLQNSQESLSGAVSGQLYYDTLIEAVHYYDGNKWIGIGSGTGGVSQLANIILEPEFGATFTEDGTDNKGSLEADTELDGRAYYQWSSSRNDLNDIDLQAHITLPEDFDRLTHQDNLTINYLTQYYDQLENRIELTALDSNGSPLGLSGVTTLTSSGTWNELNLTLSGSSLLPDDEITVNFKLFSKDGNKVRLGKIILDYLK